MIITVTQSMQAFVVGQTRSRAEARTHKIDGYRYAYAISGIKTDEMSLDEVYKVVDCLVYDAMQAGETKDMEIMRDANFPLFTFRFFAERRLAESYDIEMLWVSKDTPVDEKGNPIITEKTPLYGRDEIPNSLEKLTPIVYEIIEIK